MELLSARTPARADGLPMLLVAVNLLLLSFFVLLNAMSSAPTSKTEGHADDVLARVREGYDAKAVPPNTGNALPSNPVTSWAEAMAQNVQGVLTNRLQLQAEVLTKDADRVVLRLPLSSLFTNDQLRDAELVKSLQLAAQGAQLQWQLAGKAPQLVGQGAQLAPLTDSIALVSASVPELRLIIRPMPQTPATIGNGLQNFTTQQGGKLQGEAAP